MAIRPHLVSGSQAQGVLHVHSSPAALCPHIEWAAQACGADSAFSWLPQSAMPGTKRAEVAWRGQLGTGVALASRLARFGQIRFEITESADGSQGMRYAYTPSLGSFSAAIGPHGDVMLSENQLRHTMTQTEPSMLSSAIDQLLGGPWDAELEVFRYAETDGSVRWLHRVS